MKKQRYAQVLRLPTAFFLVCVFLSFTCFSQQKPPAGWKATSDPGGPVISNPLKSISTAPVKNAVEIKPGQAEARSKQNTELLSPLPFTCGSNPIGLGDNYVTEKDKTLTISAPGLLANDFDPNGDAIIVSNYFPPTHGMLTSIVTNGSFIYVPNPGFTGTDEFRYILLDANGNFSEQVTVTIQVVEPFNRKPLGISDNYGTPAGTQLTIPAPGLLANDLDPDGDAIIVSNFFPPSNGTLTSIVTNGSFVYVPNPGFTGTDQFRYILLDADGVFSDQVTVNIEVFENFNRKPVGMPDHYGILAGQTLTIAAPGLLTNDVDPDGDAIIVSNFFQPSHGTITSIVTNGSFTYVPNPGFTGTDEFRYILLDAKGVFSDQVTVTINVVAAGGINPIGSADTYLAEKDKTLTIAAPGLLANDFDPNGDAIIVSNYFPPTHGMLTSIVTNGSFIYVPNPGFTGTDEFRYILRDANGNFSDQATVTIQVVEPFNRKPLGISDNYGTPAETPLTIPAPGLLANDLDPDGDAIIVSNYFPPSHGTLTSIVTNGSFIYVPDPGFTGTDQFRYILRDAKGVFSDPVTVNIEVFENFNRKPVGMPDHYGILAGQTLTIAAPGLLTNDVDPDGDAIIVSNFFQTSHGTITSIVTNGSFTYVPNPGFTGTDEFRYILLDAKGVFSDQVTVTIEVVGINEAPVALANDFAVECTGPVGTMVTLDGSGSTDKEGGTLTYTWYENNSIIAGPTSASTASATFSTGIHTVKLKVEDACGESSETTISVTVQDTRPPIVHAELLPAPTQNDYIVSCNSSDVCSPVISSKSLILVPKLKDPSVSLKNKNGYSLDIDEKKNTVSVQAPDAAAFWAMIVANGGILVNGGQVIEAKYDKNKYQFGFDEDGNLVSVKAVVVTLQCTATDANGNTGVGEYSLPMISTLVKTSTLQDEGNALIGHQNYPNPFTGKTTIQFNLAEKAFVQIAVLDMTGRVIEQISSKQMQAGTHRVDWNAGGRAAGVYFYQIRQNGKQVTGKMLLLNR